MRKRSQAPALRSLATAGALALAVTAGPAAGQQGDAEGDTYVAATHGDWQLRCSRRAEACQAHQILKLDDGTTVAEVSVFQVEGGGAAVAGATVITPLETLLPEGVRIRVDAGDELQYPFSFCASIGCVSQLGLRAEELEAYKRGTAAAVTIFSAAAPDRPVVLRLSLKGFTAAYKDLQKR